MLRQQLQTDLIVSMKAKDDVRTGALRLLLSNVRNKQIEVGHELTDEEFLLVVSKEVKQRKDSIAQFTAADRTDLAETELAELNILLKYMPEQLGLDQVATEVDKAIASTGATSAADMGKVMAALSHFKGTADMGQVSQLVRHKLAS